MLAFDNKRVHNFSIGTLDAYFNLNKLLSRLDKKVIQHDGFFFMNRGAAKMTMVYDSDKANNQIEQIKKYQKLGPVYSIDPISLEYPNKFIEILYDLDVVFDPKSYKNAKKRYNRIVYPFKFIKKHDISYTLSVSAIDYKAIKKLHDAWVEYKLKDPKTFKMMFPGKRYINCVDVANANNCICTAGFGVAQKEKNVAVDYCIIECTDKNNELIAVRVISIEKDTAYDLAFFGKVWALSSQVMNYLDIVLLKAIKEKYDISYFNCGAASSTGLKKFKIHIPSTELISWRYKRDKPKIKNDKSR